MIAELKAKELTFWNFANPENLLGFSTLIRWDGKTNTGERLETIQNFQARSNVVFSSLLRLEYALSSGQRMEDIRKDTSMVAFFMSPEVKYMLALSGRTSVDTAMQEYNLHKAHELKNYIINWDILAESYYDKLKGTPYEKEADKERIGALEYARKKWFTDFGNTFLSLDQLGLLVAWWAIWKWVWATIAMSPKLAQVSVQATEKLSNGAPWIVTRVIPWVSVVKTQVGEWLATTLTKFGVNFPLEIGKFAWYETLAKQFWWDDTAQIVAMLMMVIPWAKEGFASSLRGKVVQDMSLRWEFAKWIQATYWENKAKQMLYAGLVEAKTQSGKMAKTGYDAELGSAVEKMIIELRAQIKVEPVKKIVTEAIAPVIPKRKLNQMWAVLVGEGNNKSKPTTTGTETPKNISAESPKEQSIDKQLTTSQEKPQSVLEITAKYKTLYEDPEYDFLALEKYKKLREVFPNLSYKDMVGEWNNAIILKHPDEKLVIKIAKPNGDKLDLEYENHVKFRQKLEALKQEKWASTEYAYLHKFRIPRMEEIEWMKWVYEMEKVNGHALKTLITIKSHAESLKDLPNGWYHSMTDNEVDILLRARWLKTYPRNMTEMNERWWDTVDRHFLVDLESESTKIMKTDDIDKIIRLLKDHWYNHGDDHWWNIMQTTDNQFYIIDFWRSKIK